MGLTRLAWRTVAARPLRSLLTIIGIGLGIAVLTASLTLGDALEPAVDRTVRDMVGRADLRVSGFLETGPVRRIRRDDRGARRASRTRRPIVEHRTFPSGSPTGEPADAVTVLGIDPAPTSASTTSRSSPAAASKARTSPSPSSPSSSPPQRRLHGRQQAQPPRRRRRSPSSASSGSCPGFGPVAGTGRTVVMPIDVARAAFGLHGVDAHRPQPCAGRARVRLGVARATDDRAVRPRLAGGHRPQPAGLLRRVPGHRRAGCRDRPVRRRLPDRQHAVDDRRRAGPRGRAPARRRRHAAGRSAGSCSAARCSSGSIGAGPRRRSSAPSSPLLMAGAVSDATGLAADLSQLDVDGALTAGAVGIGITLLAAIEPAFAAARISPVEALRNRFDLPNVRRGRLSWIGVHLPGRGGRLRCSPGRRSSPRPERSGPSPSTACCSSRPCSRRSSSARSPASLGLPLALFLRIEERLARGSLARDRSRTTLTLGSLVIGLAMVVALGWSAQAARASAFAWLDDVVPGDEIVTSIRPIGADEPVQDALAGIPGVARVTPIASFDLAFRGMRVDAAAVVGADLLADGRLTAVSGDRTQRRSAPSMPAAPRSCRPASRRRSGSPSATRCTSPSMEPAARSQGRRDRRALDARHERRGDPRRLEGRHGDAGRPRRRRVRGPLLAGRRRDGAAGPSRGGPDAMPSNPTRSSASRAPSPRPSPGSSASSTPWRSSPSSWRPSAS